MRIITKNIYRFDELSEEAQARAISDYRENMEHYFLGEDMMERLSELLTEHNIYGVDTQVRYSLGYSQGDGASFIGDIEYKGYRADITPNQWGNHYQHSRSVSVAEMLHLETNEDAPDELYKELEGIVEHIGDALAKYGYDWLERAESDEAIIDEILANEYEFYEDGGRL